MKYPRTAAGYAEYLKSEHWDRLRSAVLARDGGRCVRCHGFGWQVHHKFYRDDWETAQPSDCETLCRPCHEKKHPDKVQPPQPRPPVMVAPAPVVRVTPTPPTGIEEQLVRLQHSRSRREITHSQFHQETSGLCPNLTPEQISRLISKAAKRIRKALRANRPKRKKRLPPPRTHGCKPWFYSPKKPKWVNRGSSTN